MKRCVIIILSFVTATQCYAESVLVPNELREKTFIAETGKYGLILKLSGLPEGGHIQLINVLPPTTGKFTFYPMHAWSGTYSNRPNENVITAHLYHPFFAVTNLYEEPDWTYASDIRPLEIQFTFRKNRDDWHIDFYSIGTMVGYKKVEKNAKMLVNGNIRLLGPLKEIEDLSKNVRGPGWTFNGGEDRKNYREKFAKLMEYLETRHIGGSLTRESPTQQSLPKQSIYFKFQVTETDRNNKMKGHFWYVITGNRLKYAAQGTWSNKWGAFEGWNYNKPEIVMEIEKHWYGQSNAKNWQARSSKGSLKLVLLPEKGVNVTRDGTIIGFFEDYSDSGVVAGDTVHMQSSFNGVPNFVTDGPPPWTGWKPARQDSRLRFDPKR